MAIIAKIVALPGKFTEIRVLFWKTRASSSIAKHWKIASMTNQRHMFDINLWFRFAVPSVYSFLPLFIVALFLFLARGIRKKESEKNKRNCHQATVTKTLEFILILHFMSENHFIYLLVFAFWWLGMGSCQSGKISHRNRHNDLLNARRKKEKSEKKTRKWQIQHCDKKKIIHKENERARKNT